MLRFFYTMLLVLLSPLLLVRLWWRGRKEAGYRAHIGERFGEFSAAPLIDSIWIHAVSLGEMQAAAPLVGALRQHFPARPMLLTCMTATGRASAEAQFGAFATISYLPYDFPWAMQALIARFRPSIALVMETEIWPNLLASCHEAKVPVLLVNARLSERSRARYARYAPVRRLAREALTRFHAVLAQSADDASRFTAQGAHRTIVTGNVKFDLAPPQALIEQGMAWRQSVAPRRVLLAASTRDGEEALVIDAYCRRFDRAARQQHVLVIVPRHPQRFDAVHQLIVDAGLAVSRRSAVGVGVGVGLDVGNSEVWLGDSMNELFAYYAMCDVAFVGGSLVPVGGHNLIEACAIGKPVLMGPSTFNFADAARHAAEAGALLPVDSADALAEEAYALLHDQPRRDRMAASASAFATAHRGATAKTMAVIAPLLTSV
jgi:3-deoxy-D-manno-octulosonic-acid transferase